jgi:hypothetical protein
VLVPLNGRQTRTAMIVTYGYRRREFVREKVHIDFHFGSRNVCVCLRDVVVTDATALARYEHSCSEDGV